MRLKLSDCGTRRHVMASTLGVNPCPTAMNELIEIIQYIVSKSSELKNKHTDATDAPVDYACIFCQNDKEYETFTKEVEKSGKIIQDTPTGFNYLLNESLATQAGSLRLVKIRKPDPIRPERGDADFNTNYENFKKKYHNNSKFELIKRETFEMLRLSDPNFDVMACFSNTPLSKTLHIKL